ncbi:(d)CMP kinase [Novosphingobium sp. ERN07]|uniref:(d)CMP kinase n=1 Tax=Novosphingobium sp. ERN07 TaxID=2726187 RepID=UPI0014573551|nr:d(CMP) kinase [Novosphingobium sp. ERN07]NLR71887.1 (d)CMP kinase [Novosphingobium sp. ERN07]
MIIAVDGPTASGKGTIAKALAAHFALPHLDTGLLYRAVGRQVMLSGGNPDDADAALAACHFPESLLDDPELRSEESGGYASRVSVHPPVRTALLARQQAFANQAGGAVLDGRDIATVIAPHADAKLFVTASVSARAMRRWVEMKGLGKDVEREAIEADLAERDERDRNRAEAPLRHAEGATLLDTSNLTKEMAVATAIALVEKQVAAGKCSAAKSG